MNGGSQRREPKPGVIEAVLPNRLFRVRLSDGSHVNAGPSAALRGTSVRLIAGSRVLVTPSRNDPGRGQIVEKL